MNEAVRISQIPPERVSMNYAALRERGMALIRQLAKETWTDHNVHDPGITLLEAFSYAITELGFRLQLEMADLLRSGESHALPDLIPAHRTLPSAPVTPDDLHKVLLDHHLVSEAWITAESDGEVPFYEAPGADPPFTYEPGPLRVRLQGLYEVMLAFEEREWNSNTYRLEVAVGDNRYWLDMALPHWDEAEAAPFRAGITVDNVVMLNAEGNVWRALAEPQSYFATVQVDYTSAAGNASIELWVLLRINGDLDQPAAVIPGILAAAQTHVESNPSGGLIEQFAERVRASYRGVLQIQRYLERWRNLCEQPIRLNVARVQEIAIRARIEVTGSTDLEQLLAEIFLAIDLAINPPRRFYGLAEMRAQGKTTEALYDGPLLRHGFLSDIEPDSLIRSAQIHSSDILRIIMRLRQGASSDIVMQENPTGRDIVAVTDLALSNFVNNRPITSDAQDCLRLVEIERYRPRLSLSKSRINFVRNDLEVRYDLRRVEALFLEMQSQQQIATRPSTFSPVWTVQPGDVLPVEDYFAFQNDLPRIYGVGEARLPEGGDQKTNRERQAQTLQLKGYLLLFEQFLADLTAQLGHMNRFFAADPEEPSTYFTRPLLDLPEMEKLLKRFPRGGDWAAFVVDSNNAYRVALQTAVESEAQFLDRRNRMLDHLLARQGEATVAWSQELHRWAQQELSQAALPPDQLLVQMEARRRAVNARLIRDKAAFLKAVPELNATKLQAFGDPLRRHPDVLQLEQTDNGFRWLLRVEGEPRLRSVDDFGTGAAAMISAEAAAVLAAQSEFYQVINVGGGRYRYQLMDGTDGDTHVVGESGRTWTTENTAQDALATTAALFADIRMQNALTSMEQRIAYLTGIRSQTRRRLCSSLDAFFEIYDEGDDDSSIEKRWRLWELPGYSGRVLLSSVFHFAAPTEVEAIALAEASIQRVLRYGLDEWNYHLSTAGADTFNFALRHPNGDLLGLRNPPIPSVAETQTIIHQTIAHLYLHYGAEGFHLVEHLLLRPRQRNDQTQDRFLSFPLSDSERERDPYSHRLSLVFPSGYARDFSLAANQSPRREVSPHRFRDPEFRRHAERIVQQACPAHLLPKIYWVDRHIPLAPTSPTGFETLPGCFEHFENAYFTWLETQLIPGLAQSEVDAARNALIIALNEVANDGVISDG